MNKRLHILHLEDDPDFAETVREMLRRGGLDAQVKQVGDRPAFELALDMGTFDAILSDYRLPSFTGLEALALARKRCPLTPFILVSESAGEDIAVESLKAGAADYILKQRPRHLPAAVRTAVQKAAERRVRFESEAELARREKHFRALTENSLDVLWILDRRGVFSYASPSSLRVLGCAPDELTGRSVYDRIHPEDAPRARQVFAAAVEDPARPVEVEVRHRHPDGSWRHIELVGQSRLADPEIAGVVVHCRDITERRRVERNLRESEKHYRILFNDNPNAMWVFDLETLLFLEVNEAAIQQYGWSRAEFLAMKMTDLQAPMRGGQVNIPDWRGGSSHVWRHRRKDASLMDVEVVWTPMAFRGRFAALALATDVTERRRIEHRDFVFSKLGHGLSSATTPAAAAMIICETADTLFKWDNFAIDLYSAERDEVFSLLSIATVDGRRVELPQSVQPKAASKLAKRVIEHGAELFTHGEAGDPSAMVMLAPIRRASRVLGILFVQAEPPTIFTHRDLETLQILADHCAGALERLRAEQDLRSSEIRFRSVWENSADGMWLTDETGVIVAANNAVCKLVGMDSRALEGRPFTVIYAASEDTETMLTQHREFFQRPGPGPRKKEDQYTLHNGRRVTLEIADSFIGPPDSALLCLSLFRDVSGQRLLEQQLRQSQKMEAIGQLAGGVAHDFNNILTVIHGHASLLTAAGLEHPAARSAQQITQAAERAAGLTRQLLTFSRRQLIQPRRLDLNQVVGTMTNMLGRLLSEDLALQLNYSPAPPMVEADVGMMEQVLLNLAVNARDAMPRGGQLSVGISIVAVEKATARHPDARDGHFVCLSVSDTGCGIPSGNLTRIFEPFFTTKEVGRGTGLGLATVYGIVKQHQGWIEVESAPNNGTTFRIYIPYVGVEPDKETTAATTVKVRGGNETILLVEDEAPVRELVSSVLAEYGYKVFPACNGVQALEIWRQKRDQIALLLTDLIMPENINGRELAEKLRAERRELKVIFSSGYSADIVGKDFKLDPELNFLQKPYHPKTLALAVRRCLDGRIN